MSTTAGISVADLRPVDLFDDLDDAQLAEWAAVAQRQHFEPGELLAEQGVDVRGLSCLLEGEAQTVIVSDGRTEPVGRQVAPTWIGAISVLTRGPLPCAWRRRRRATSRSSRPTTSAASRSRSRRCTSRVMRQMKPVMSRLAGAEQNRERLESLGTMAAGLAHELNNPAAAVKRAASDLADALEVIGATLGEFVEAGIERDDAERLVALQREALARRREAHERSTASTPPTPRTRCSSASRSSGSPSRGAWPSRWRWPASTRRGWTEVAELAGPATGAALRWVAASLTARGLAADLLDSASRMGDLVDGDQVLRLHGPRRRWWRSTSTRASRRRSSCSATSSSTPRSRSCATTTARCRS